MPLATYRPSGRVRATAVLFSLGAAVAVAALAWLYQLLVRVIPLIYLNAIIALLFGVGIGALLAFVLHAGHCRNRLLAAVLGLFVGAVGTLASHYWEYRHVVSKLESLREEAGADEVRGELSFSEYFDLKRMAGWKIRGANVRNGGVTAVWVIEALMLMGGAVVLAWGSAGAPYCEKCGKWCEDKAIVVPGATAADAQPLVDRGDADGLPMMSAPAGGGDPAARLVIKIDHCPGCLETGFVSVEEKRTVEKKGKTEEKSNPIVTHAVLSPPARAAALDRVIAVEGQKLPG